MWKVPKRVEERFNGRDSGVGDIGNVNVILKTQQKALDVSIKEVKSREELK
jgi:hypothetical protein